MLHGLFDRVLDEPVPQKLTALTAAKPNRKLYRAAAVLAWLLVGILLGLAGGWLFREAVERKWTSDVARQIGNPALAFSLFQELFRIEWLVSFGSYAIIALAVLI